MIPVVSTVHDRHLPAAEIDSSVGGGGRGFDVRPAALGAAGGVFDAEADALGDLVATLTAELEALGPCWGDDEVGQRFATAYLAAGRTVIANLASLSSAAIRIAAALRAVADSYEAADGALPPGDVGRMPPAGAPPAPAIGPVAPGERERRLVRSPWQRGSPLMVEP
jgi:uncharacterized protein YukE